MSSVNVAEKVPDFQLPATGGKMIRLADFNGQNVVLYFYPKDNTPGCTLETQDFRDRHEQFSRLNTIIFGVSRDSMRSHDSFKSAQNCPFDLISDESEQLCQLFDVLKPKNLYGKQVVGVERSTFLIDAQGILRREWRKVKVDSHADEVLDAVRNLSASGTGA